MKWFVPTVLGVVLAIIGCVGPDSGSGRLPPEEVVKQKLLESEIRQRIRKDVSVELTHMKCRQMEQAGIDSARDFATKFGQDATQILSFARCDMDAVVNSFSVIDSSPNKPVTVSKNGIAFYERQVRDTRVWEAPFSF